MRRLAEQTIPEDVARRLAELTAQVAELTRRLALMELVRGTSVRHPQTQPSVAGSDKPDRSTEFHTENGFVIVRTWEVDGTAPPGNGRYRFRVTNPNGLEKEILVRVSGTLMSSTAMYTNGRIALDSTFWLCCAERQLANYVAENDRFPDACEMAVAELDREEVMLATRWGKR